MQQGPAEVIHVYMLNRFTELGTGHANEHGVIASGLGFMRTQTD